MSRVKNLIIWICALLTSVPGFSTNDDNWNKIFKLTNEEIKFLEKKDATPENTLRLTEAYSERLKLIFEKENKMYLLGGENQDRSKHFKETQEEFEKVEKFGIRSSEGIKNCAIRGQLHYRLAVNSKDFGNSKSLEAHLLKAIAPCSTDDKTASYFAEEMLAEYYMGQKKFSEASTYFSSIIRKKPSDKFIVRNYYQLAWAYLKTSRPQEALNSVEKAINLMVNTGSTQFKDQLMRLKILLLISNNKVDEGIIFFSKLKDPKEKITYLILFAEALRSSGKKNSTLKTLNLANEVIDQNNFYEIRIDITREYLLSYEEFKMFNEYLKLQQDVWGSGKKLKAASSEIKSEILLSLKKITNHLDALIKKDTFQDKEEKKSEIFKLYENYLKELIFLDHENRSEYYFFLAESYFIRKMFTLSSKYYLNTLLTESQKNTEERKSKSFNALFNIAKKADDLKLEDSELKKNLDATFSLYLKLNPKGDFASDIFPTIISRFIKNDKFEDAITHIEQFSKLYPSKLESQQILELELIDKLFEKKQLPTLIIEAQKIRTGFLGFNKIKSEQIDENLSTLIFSRTSEASQLNTTNLKILKDNRLPGSIRSIAAINLSSYFTSKNDQKNSKNLFEFSLQNMKKNDVTQNKKKFIDQILQFALSQDFQFAEKNSKNLLITVCEDKDTLNDSLFRIYLNLLNANTLRTEKIHELKNLRICLSQEDVFTKEMSTLNLDHILTDLNDYQRINLLIPALNQNESLKVLRKEIMTQYFLGSLTFEDLKKLSLNSPGLGLKNIIEDLSNLVILRKEMSNFKNLKIWDNEIFEPVKFNSHLESYLTKLAQKISHLNNLLKSEVPEIIFQGLNMVCDLTFTSHEKISNLSPKGLDPEIKDVFLQEMLKISSNIQKNYSKCTKDRDAFLEKSSSNGNFLIHENKFMFLNLSSSSLSESMIFLDRNQEDGNK
jgi:hypothetical protein